MIPWGPYLRYLEFVPAPLLEWVLTYNQSTTTVLQFPFVGLSTLVSMGEYVLRQLQGCA